MAIESIQNHIFTMESLFSLGFTPYPGVPIDEEFIDRILGGLRLNQPFYCPDEIFSAIMKKCWNRDPNSRPKFDYIAQFLLKYFQDDVNLGYIDICNQFNDFVAFKDKGGAYFVNSGKHLLENGCINIFDH